LSTIWAIPDSALWLRAIIERILIFKKRLAKEGYFVMYPFSCSNIISRFGFETEKGTADRRAFLTRNRMEVRLKIRILPDRFSVQRPVLRSLG